MKHIPMLFSTPMAIANINGSKTQTRRIKGLAEINENPNQWMYQGMRIMSLSVKEPRVNCAQFTDNPFIRNVKCPYGQPGDVIWQRETHAAWTDNNDSFAYKADGFKPRYQGWERDTPNGIADVERIERWTPGIHMPKTACRYFAEITNIRVERLADICANDAVMEGIEIYNDVDFGEIFEDYIGNESFTDPVKSYRSLWNKINGQPSPIQKKVDGKLKTVGYIAYPFDEASLHENMTATKGLSIVSNTYRKLPLTIIVNPWVWVISYKPTERPNNFL